MNPTFSLKGEIWKPALGFPGYFVSSMGRVFSLKKPANLGAATLMRITPDHNGYAKIGLYLNKKVKRVSVHTLVLESFVSKRPQGKQAAHLNGNRMDNRPENLKWTTAKENTLHKNAHGTMLHGSQNGFAKLKERDIKEILKLLAAKKTCVSIAKKYKVHRTTISLIKHGKSWRRAIAKADEIRGNE